MRAPLRPLGFCLLVLSLSALAACGDTRLPEAPSTSPFAASTVSIRQVGNAPVTIDPSTVSFALDDARSLRVMLRLTSQASGPVTVSIRASLYDSRGGLIGDATGGQPNLQPGVATPLMLTGPTPLGTIASATLEASIPPPTTPLPTGAPAPASQLPIPPPPT